MEYLQYMESKNIAYVWSKMAKDTLTPFIH